MTRDTARPIDRTPEWQALVAHHDALRDRHLRDLFAEDPARATRLTAEGAGLYLDYSKHRVTDETLELLVALARAAHVEERREAMFFLIHFISDLHQPMHTGDKGDRGGNRRQLLQMHLVISLSERLRGGVAIYSR